MSAAWLAFWAMVLAPSTLYLTKRVIDYTLPPGQHWPWLDRFSEPNKSDDDDSSTGVHPDSDR